MATTPPQNAALPGCPPSPKRARVSPLPSTSRLPAAEPGQDSCDSGLSDPVSPGQLPGPPQQQDEDSLSGLSDLSGQEWKPDTTSKLSWLQAAMRRGEDPRAILATMLSADSTGLPPDLDDLTIWKILFSALSEPPRRSKLDTVNTLEDCAQLIKQSSNIIILTGAGVSVSCGIPDFRSRDGVYARLAQDFPDLPDPQAMFDIHYFRKDPRPFFKFAREIYPGQFQPSPCHRFIRAVERSGKLLRNFTQNIDTLEQVAGISRVIQCHGSFATASCMVCKRKVEADEIKADIFSQTTPMCTVCPAMPPVEEEAAPAPEAASSLQLLLPDRTFVPTPVMKPDIVFFGEGLPEHFHECIARDKESCDLLIVIGSSLKVRPVALIPSSLDGEIPQILINREPLPHCSFDVELLGDCDSIVNQLCLMLGEGWEAPVHRARLSQHTGLPPQLQRQDHEEQEAAFPSTAGPGASSDHSPTHNSISDTKDEGGEDVESESNSNSQSKDSEREKPTPDGSNNDVDSDSEADDEDWKVKSLAESIPEGKFLFLPPARYVFPGAEVFPDSSDDEAEDEVEGEEERLSEDGPVEAAAESERAAENRVETASEQTGDRNAAAVDVSQNFQSSEAAVTTA